MAVTNAVSKATLKKNSRSAANKSTKVEKPAKVKKPTNVGKSNVVKTPKARNQKLRQIVYKTYRENSKPLANGKSVLYAHEEGGPELAHGEYSSKVWLHRPLGIHLCTIWKHYFEVKNIGGRWTTFEHIYSTPEEYQAALEKWCQANNVPVEDGAAV